MNKKLAAGIIAAIAAVIAIVIVILSVTGTIKFGSDKKDGQNTSSEISSQTVESGEDADGDKDENDSNSTVSGNSANEQSGDKTSDGKDGGTESQEETKPVKKQNVEADKNSAKIIVPVYIEKNPGIVAAKPVLKFDTNAFSYADCKDGDIFSGWQGNFANGKIVLLGSADDVSKNNTKTGVLVNVILTPKKGIKSGTYKITVENDSEYANTAEKLVKPTVSVADVVIK